MKNVKLKNSAYAIVDTEVGKIVATDETREQARSSLQIFKYGLGSASAKKYKIAKLSVIEKFVR